MERVDYELNEYFDKAEQFANTVDDCIAAGEDAPIGEVSSTIYKALNEAGIHWLSIEELKNDIKMFHPDVWTRLKIEEGYED